MFISEHDLEVERELATSFLTVVLGSCFSDWMDASVGLTKACALLDSLGGEAVDLAFVPRELNSIQDRILKVLGDKSSATD